MGEIPNYMCLLGKGMERRSLLPSVRIPVNCVLAKTLVTTEQDFKPMAVEAYGGTEGMVHNTGFASSKRI